MKTHELAKALRLLADILDKTANSPLEDLERSLASAARPSTGQMALSLSMLTDLSNIDKQQWLTFINEMGFPIEVRPRDASRDLLGKILTYLEANEHARAVLRTRATSKDTGASPELMKALSSLLKD